MKSTFLSYYTQTMDAFASATKPVQETVSKPILADERHRGDSNDETAKSLISSVGEQEPRKAFEVLQTPGSVFQGDSVIDNSTQKIDDSQQMSFSDFSHPMVKKPRGKRGAYKKRKTKSFLEEFNASKKPYESNFQRKFGRLCDKLLASHPKLAIQIFDLHNSENPKLQEAV